MKMFPISMQEFVESLSTPSVSIFSRKVRVALTPRHWMLKTSLTNGAVVSGRNRPGYGGRGIYVFRDSLEPELQYLERLLVPVGVFADVGANVGVYTIKAAQFFSKNGGVVVAYEPLPEMLTQLNQNVIVNGFDRVRLRSFCLGANRCATELWVNFRRPNSCSLLKTDPKSTRMSTLVLPLDEVFPIERLDRLDYLKVDVEGAEAQVLAGGIQTLTKYRPIIQLEISHVDAQLNLPAYSEWWLPGGPNKVCVPNESSKNEVLCALGWQKRI
jgi:FkbM family methyltransferase